MSNDRVILSVIAKDLAYSTTSRARFFASLKMTVVLICCAIGARLHAAELRTIETKYYVLHTDLPDLAAREAALRMTKMAELYRDRTSAFAKRVPQKLPFFLYGHLDDYYAAGGLKGTSGLFTGDKLLAVVIGGKTSGLTWQTIQHEGFHQFAHAAIARDLPPWLDEGLAEYFGEAIFTGDGYVDGAIPPWRAKRIQRRIEKKEFPSLRELMKLSKPEWNRELSLANYDHAWSIVQFLAHGDDDKYQKPFEEFMVELSSGHEMFRAFQKELGDVETFELKWKRYWTTLPPEPTPQIYAKAVESILNSFLSRATVQGQRFKSFDDFVTAGKKGQIKLSDDNWLPPQLLQDGIAGAERLEKEGMKFEIISNQIRCDNPR